MPDIKTVMVLYLIINIVNTGTIAIIWRRNRGRSAGISFWLIGLSLQAFGPLLLVLRGMVPDIISMTGSNTIVLAGILVILIGLERFTGVKGRQIHNYVLLALFMAVSAYFVVVQPNLMARDIAVTAMIMIYTLQCSWLLLRRVDQGMRQVTGLTGIVFAVYAVFSFARIILTVIIPEKSNDFFNSGAVNALAITGYTLLNICLTISLVLMVNNRLLADVKAEEARFRLLVENSHDIIYTLTPEGVFTFVSPAWTTLLGHPVKDINGHAFQPFVHPDDLPQCTAWLQKVIDTGQRQSGIEYRVRHIDGSWRWHTSSAVPLRDDSGRINGYEGIASDISERKRIEQQLRERMKELQAIYGLAELNTREGITLENLYQELACILPKSCQYPEIACARVEIDGSEFRTDNFTDSPWKLSSPVNVNKSAAGRIEVCYLENRPALDEGPFLKEERILLNALAERIGHITERRLLEKKLEEMATHDFLTGLPNRNLLTDRFGMAAALAHRNGARLAVMSLDLDNFKTVNDTLGHVAGDQVLKTVSARLTAVIRASDTLARIGGDEFILVMMETNHAKDASTIARKILDAFEEPLLIDGNQLHLSTSIGIAIYPEDAQDMETLIKKSDAALYYAKGHGRNQFKFFGDGDVRIGGDNKSARC